MQTNSVLKTSFDYFGARYYLPELSIWASVDPLADKYPSVSSYMYVLGNPIRYTDPDGRWVKGAGFWNNILKSDKKINAQRKILENKDNLTTKEYIQLAQLKQGARMSRSQKKMFIHGCVGIVQAKANTTIKPDIKDSFDDFDAAQKFAEELRKKNPNSEVIIFAFEFHSPRKSRHSGDPKTHRVDLIKYPPYYNGKQRVKGKRWGNFNYTLFDATTGDWYGANHSREGMEIYKKSTQDVKKYNRDVYNTQVFSVTIVNP